ncbi:MAG: DUF2490 domain-containing protein [Verrucomicrobiota bacterium]|nr:DUF2490 domain-containing protein [Verrucomicrobiota bacterium]
MRKIPLHTHTLLLLIFLGMNVQAGSGFESWLNISLGQRLDYGLEAKVETEQWFASESPTYKHIEIMPQLIWHYSPRYDFTVGYAYDWTQQSNRMITVGNSGFFDTTVKIPFQRFNLSSRQRLQFGTEATEEDQNGFVALYRPKTVLEYEMPWLPLRLMPFVADEVFFDMNTGVLLENRAQIGVAYRINKSWRIEVYGMRVDQWDMTGENSNFPVAGLNFAMQF